MIFRVYVNLPEGIGFQKNGSFQLYLEEKNTPSSDGAALMVRLQGAASNQWLVNNPASARTKPDNSPDTMRENGAEASRSSSPTKDLTQTTLKMRPQLLMDPKILGSSTRVTFAPWDRPACYNIVFKYCIVS